MTASPHRHWIVTADNRAAAIYACTTTPGGEVHVDHVKSLQNPHEQEHERGRPSLLGGAERRGSKTRSSAGAAPHSVAVGHETEEEHRRFAKEAGAWLVRAAKDAGVSHVSVFVAPRFLSLLRGELADGLGEQSDVHEAELGHLRANELAVHPAVLSALGHSKGGGTRPRT